MHSFRGQLIGVKELDIYHDLRELVKVYPTHSTLVRYHHENIVRKAGYEDTIPNTNNTSDHHSSVQASQDSVIRSLRRSRQLITDVILCNEFDLFTTFTFKKDRQDIEKCKAKMSTWLKNQRRDLGRFRYLIVPEFHKDRKSLHFHALFGDYRGQLIDSGKYINSRPAYNIPSYRSGFTTAVKIDNQEAVSLYVRKYITKDMPLFAGKKRFWLSTGLQRPVTLHNQDLLTNSALNWGEIYNNDLFTLYRTHDIIKMPS